MSLHHSLAPENRAYREAGHTVMTFLIWHGYIPWLQMNPAGVLPEHEHIAIEGQSVEWGDTTAGLGSLIVVPNVLLAGYLAENIKYPKDANDLLRSPLIQQALTLIAGYIAEYGSEDMSQAQLNQYAKENLDILLSETEGKIRAYWMAVEAVAKSLLKNKSLTKQQAFEIIEQAIPEDIKVQAKKEIAQKREVIRQAIMKEMEEDRARILAEKQAEMKQKKQWWKFWD